ncbi:MAG: uracil-DNA glycosylase [Chitinispirillales bacterium]|jgi:DNA polymerase|nr:uracil-DNA glycosylase [Chitinispirillales bacterium]
MTGSIHSLLTAYLQCQRDLGVDEFVFERGSDVRKGLLDVGKATGQPRVAAAQVSRGGGYGEYDGGGAGGYDMRRQASEKPAAAGASPFSKLSKIRTVDALGAERYERPVLDSAPPVSSIKREKLAELYRDVIKCGNCALSANRAKVVFGSGSADGTLFVIGDAPTPQDEAAGLAFQGEAGQLFGNMLNKMALDLKKNVFATYIQKCRDVNSSDGDGFDKEYAGICKSILDKQMDIIEPKALLIFGQPSANFLLENDSDIEQLRAANHSYREKPVIVTYSLSLLLTETQYRYGAWDDLKKVMNLG